MFKLHNTLTGQVEQFVPLNPPKVGMYVCGPTVYDVAHIGNFRTFIFADLLRRYLKFKGFDLHHVMNITDVEDKIIAKSLAENVSLREFTNRYVDYFFEDFDALGAERPEEVLRATDHINEMITLVNELSEHGHTYQSAGSTYFKIQSFPAYGELSKINLDGNVAGASDRVEADEYTKEDARDFVLWKAPKTGEPFWEAPFGPGRPGWHLECSAMSMKALGRTFDIHAGGVDLIFPHHENEIAQSEGATGQKFVRFWVHAEFLMVEGEKMSKSKGNFFTFRDLVEKGHSPRAIRYLLLSAPHHRQLNFTLDGLRGAESTVARLNTFRVRLDEIKKEGVLTPSVGELANDAMSKFETALDNDLNTAEALAAIHDFVRDVNTMLATGNLTIADRDLIKKTVDQFDAVFNVFGEVSREILDSEVEALIEERRAARAARNFARSDEIRQELANRGIILEDTKDGVRWRRQ